MGACKVQNLHLKDHCWFLCRFHSRPEVQHRWPGLPSVRVWPLANPSRRPVWCQQQTLTGRSRDPQAQRPEGGHPSFRQLPGQTVISPRLKAKSAFSDLVALILSVLHIYKPEYIEIYMYIKTCKSVTWNSHCWCSQQIKTEHLHAA